jgi:hypothetical protein
MTTEEKILNILELYKVQIFDEYGTPSFVIKIRYWNKIALEIASLFEGYYEKEFVEWLDNHREGIYSVKTTDVLYTYWQKEVKND